MFTQHNMSELRGVCIYAKTHLDVEIHTELMEIGFKDGLWVKMATSDSNRSVILGVIYRKPSRGVRQDNKLLKCIDKIGQSSEVIICGDFNLPKINWVTGRISDSEQSMAQKFYDKVSDNFLLQKVSNPTRRRGDDLPSLIDLILVNDEDSVDEVRHLPPLGAGDHDALIFEYRLPINQPVLSSREVYDFRRADFGSLRQDFPQVNWSDIYLSDDVRKQIDIFGINECMEEMNIWR